jgi:hypothetical protein
MLSRCAVEPVHCSRQLRQHTVIVPRDTREIYLQIEICMPHENNVPELTALEGSVDRSAARVMLEVTPVVTGAPRSPFWYFL